MIRQVQKVAGYYDDIQAQFSHSCKIKLATLLLAASKFDSRPWKYKALATADMITADEPMTYIHTWSRYRRCTLAALNGDFAIEESTLFCDRLDTSNARANAVYGNLLLAYAKNMIHANHLEYAQAFLNRFQPICSNDPSKMEQFVLEEREIATAKIDRYKGRFESARSKLCPLSLSGMRAYSSISHHAAICCELGDNDAAKKLLLTEMETLGTFKAQNTSGGRGIRLMLAEVYLRVGQLTEAESIYQGLQTTMETCDLNSVTAVGKVRLYMGLAMISHYRSVLPDALKHWNTALKVAHDNGCKADFIDMVVYYSVSLVKFLLSERHESNDYRRKADEIYLREGIQHWMIGIGTHWLPYVWRLLNHNPAQSTTPI